ncbi:MAG: cysteine--1-D-myo-inosityl 2-amino-2-deoxy-alpha-D-glucopyranoside ligase [Sporichthyaceae bacterium]|nr:cysteine--1-D-myo-inosityl 2-amino-2-deoxy-alpha-D-glucopyranoside ligase [Sporichthyaceae bacterium]
MESWPAPNVPKLPGAGLPLRLYDTASRALVPVGPAPDATDRTARMYVCGITPYDATHLGHAATYVTFDLVYRTWLDAGLDVRYVQNVTDVDDPLLERAAALGVDWAELGTRETDLYRRDVTALRILPPSQLIGAVEAIPQVSQLIEVLRGKGAVYEVDRDLYFPVGSDPRFGSVAKLGRAEMIALFAERGGDPDRPGKKDPLDCLLWVAERPDEPSWDSPSGKGRPGWHVECTAIALRHLGAGFDVQGGGSDLAFPHHEMCAAEGQVATGSYPFAQAYVHAGMIGLDGEKMSKSLGNLVLVSGLREAGVEPMAIRLAILASHYRADRDWVESAMAGAAHRLARWRAAVSRPDGPAATATLDRIRASLANDLDTPEALAEVDAWCAEQETRGGSDPAAPGLVSRAVDALLGIAL